MDKYLVRVRVAIVVEESELAAQDVAAAVRDELAKLTEGADHSGTDQPDVFDIVGNVDASSPIDAVLAGTANLRAAAHAAGAYTDGWPEADQWHSWMREQAVEATLISRGGRTGVPGGDTIPV